MKNLFSYQMNKIFRYALIICLSCFNLFAQDKKKEEKSLKVLILGGTSFLGPHLTKELLNHGHRVTHFNRGNGLAFPGIETLRGDRCSNLSALEGRKWDAVIDTSGYIPRVVEASSKVLAKATNYYIFISTISVYDNFKDLHLDENSPLAKLEYDDEKITDKTYGPLKAGCEKIIKTYFPDNSLIIRPGLIVGPYDQTDRFTYWVRRIAKGGKVLIPNTPKQKLQIIDVRDLSRWIVKMMEERASGIYNATGPKEELNFEKFVNECAKVAKNKVEFIWVDEKILIDLGFNNWDKFPLWLPSKSEMTGLFCIDSHKAREKGLTSRPLLETISDTLNWDSKRTYRKIERGLSREEEERILKQIEKNN